MKKLFAAVGMSAALLCGCSPVSESDGEMNRFISELMDKMTLHEKLGQLNLPSGGDLTTGPIVDSDLAEMIRREEIGGYFNVKGIDKIRELQRIAVEETRLGIPLVVGADIILPKYRPRKAVPTAFHGHSVRWWIYVKTPVGAG